MYVPLMIPLMVSFSPQKIDPEAKGLWVSLGKEIKEKNWLYKLHQLWKEINWTYQDKKKGKNAIGGFTHEIIVQVLLWSIY